MGTVGLLWAVAVVWILYVGAMRLTAGLAPSIHDPASLSLAFAHSLVPIPFAYSVAHYFSLLVLEEQAVSA